MPKFQHLPDLGDPHFVLTALPWLMHLFRVAAWAATAAFLVWGVPHFLERGEKIWAMWLVGGLLALISIGFAMPASFRPVVNFACDTKGVFIFYAQNKNVFVPWNAVRDIRIDTIVGSGGRSQTGLVVEARIGDAAVGARLFRKNALTGKDPVGADGYGRVGISNNARSMKTALAEIDRIRAVGNDNSG